ncbi:unnamed protein product [Cunninghamella echinulata]
MVRPDEIIKQVNVKLENNAWEDMTVLNMLTYMATHKSNCALIKNEKNEIAMVTLHETTLQPVFMETCATVYVLDHLEPEIKCGVAGMIYTKNELDISYLITIKKRDGTLRFPKDFWSFQM